MAWLYQQNGSKNWWLGYRVNGKQVLRSTKTSVRAEAERELEKVEILFGASRAGSLTEELFTALTGGGLPKITLTAEIDDWLAECRATTAEKTIVRYEAFAKEFKLALNATPLAPLLSQVTADDIRRFLNAKRTATSAGTANLARKTLSAIFIRAVKNHHLRDNPVSPIKPFKPMKGEKVSRRAYSLDELASIYGNPRARMLARAFTEIYAHNPGLVLRLMNIIREKWNDQSVQSRVEKHIVTKVFRDAKVEAIHVAVFGTQSVGTERVSDSAVKKAYQRIKPIQSNRNPRISRELHAALKELQRRNIYVGFGS